MARLAAAVHVEHPETHELLILLPGEDVDPVVAEAITNPDAWEQPETPTLDDPALIGEQPDTPTFDDPGPTPAPELESAPEPPEAKAAPEPEAKPRTRARKPADEK